MFLEWTVAPLIAFACALFLFSVIKASLLRRENAEKWVLVFLPFAYGISAGLLCLFLMFQVNFLSAISSRTLLYITFYFCDFPM